MEPIQSDVERIQSGVELYVIKYFSSLEDRLFDNESIQLLAFIQEKLDANLARSPFILQMICFTWHNSYASMQVKAENKLKESQCELFEDIVEWTCRRVLTKSKYKDKFNGRVASEIVFLFRAELVFIEHLAFQHFLSDQRAIRCNESKLFAKDYLQNFVNDEEIDDYFF